MERGRSEQARAKLSRGSVVRESGQPGKLESYARLIETKQTVDNACASVALLNIVNNIPNIELGEHLSQFKDFTAGLTPALRGDAISNFSFVKRIHNSFARSVATYTNFCRHKFSLLCGYRLNLHLAVFANAYIGSWIC